MKNIFVSIFFVTIFILSLNNSFSFSRNLGHRVGAGAGEFHKDLPENSLIAMKAALIGKDDDPPGIFPLQFNSRFFYMEFDVQETADGELVVFHDKHIKRMVPNNEKNKKAGSKILKKLSQIYKNISYKDLTIKHLTLKQIKTLYLKGSIEGKIPTLEEFLDKALEYGLQKPLTLEIKYLYTRAAKLKLIKLLVDFRERFLRRSHIIFENGYDLGPTGVNLLAFRSKFSKAFGKRGSQERENWCNFLKIHGFEKVYQAVFHRFDLCSLK